MISEKAAPISTTEKEVAVYDTISDEVVATKLNSCQLVCLIYHYVNYCM